MIIPGIGTTRLRGLTQTFLSKSFKRFTKETGFLIKPFSKFQIDTIGIDGWEKSILGKPKQNFEQIPITLLTILQTQDLPRYNNPFLALIHILSAQDMSKTD